MFWLLKTKRASNSQYLQGRHNYPRRKEATSKLRKETRTLPSYGDRGGTREERVEAEGDPTPEDKVKRKVLKLLPKPKLFSLSIKTYHLW